MTQTVLKEGGSFRDPSGFVFRHESQVYRCMDDATWRVVRGLMESGLLGKWIREGLLVGTEPVSMEVSETLAGLTGLENPHLVHHDKIPFVSYPSEWTSSMLADAALLTLHLEETLVRSGYSLKDASAFNVQFNKGRPVFIDVSSIEVPSRWNVWIAYGQFCRMFLFPLMLRHFSGVETRDVFLACVDGADVERTYRTIGPWTALRPSLVLDLFLQRQFQKMEPVKTVSPRSEQGGDSARAEIDKDILLVNIRRLAAKVKKMSKRKVLKGEWSDYTVSNSYSREGGAEKGMFVAEFLQTRRPASVLDCGCNTGRFSVAAADAGCRVVALDSDEECVDRLYMEARDKGKDILPLHMNIDSPTPAMGFMNRERMGFMERADFECVFALALIHHLLVSARIPLPAMMDMFCDLTRRWLVVEYVPVDDPMFKRLLALRENIYGYLTREHFERVFQDRFNIVSSLEIPGSGRVVYAMEKLGYSA